MWPAAVLLATGLFGGALAQLPNHPPLYQMNSSTIIMPCNASGFTDPASTAGWGIVDFDWVSLRYLYYFISACLSLLTLLCTNFSHLPPSSPSSYFPFVMQSNAKAIWATHKPMDDEELLFQQVQMTTAATKGATVWVYRCS